jgi:hypothetical protein
VITPGGSDLSALVGFGVAGNFAGHLEQAGEAADFVNVTPAATEAPKGIFPWYVPGDAGFLGTFPLASDRIELPASDEPLNLQVEPEAGVIFAVGYDRAGVPRSLTPRAIGAFNDCSIRRAGATKISHKKNWGPASKGLASDLFPIASLDADGPARTLRLACFLRRGGRAEAYGIDSPLTGYSYFGDTLTGWILDRLNHQTGSPDTPLEDVGALLRAAGSPPEVLVGIGATRYTALGQDTYLQPGDESVVVVYDGAVTNPEALARAFTDGTEDGLAAASVLRQRVVSTDGGAHPAPPVRPKPDEG